MQQPDDIVVHEVGGFESAPEGVHQGVCCDIVDMGEVVTPWGAKPTIRIVFQLELENGQRRSDGSRYEVWRKFSPKLGPKTNLQPFLESWRGRKFTPDELKSFNLKNLYLANATIQIVHLAKNDRTYSIIQSIQPWSLRSGKKIEPENYTRFIPKEDPNATVRVAPSMQEKAANLNLHSAGSGRSVTQDSSGIRVTVQDDDIPF
jgi:hypothetical protein